MMMELHIISKSLRRKKSVYTSFYWLIPAVLFSFSFGKSGMVLTLHSVPHPRAEHLPMSKQVPVVPRGAAQMYPQQADLFYPESARPPPSGSQYDAQYPTGECALTHG